jgi:AbiV family abortive infection protein
MSDNNLKRFNQFRRFCLQNAEDALTSAESLVSKKVNHIAFHLAALSLEEIGKIFLGWCYFTSTDQAKAEKIVKGVDDHIKKLFWAIWGPSFLSEKTTQKQLDEIKGFSSQIHNKRLETLYTDFADSVPASEKISDEDTKIFISMVRTRLELAKTDGEIDENKSIEENDHIKKFMTLTEDPGKRSFIFGEVAHEKLVELGNIHEWVQWLTEKFAQQKKTSDELLEKELSRQPLIDFQKKSTPKWSVKLKIITPSHSIRGNLLPAFNQRSDNIKLGMGVDNQTLIVELILADYVSAQDLFPFAWRASRIYVAALNVAVSNGLFGWNIPVDRDKFYEKIIDLDNRKEISATLVPRLELNWPKNKPVLETQALHLSRLVYDFFLNTIATPDFEYINEYMLALAMLEKSDIHMRLEVNIFMMLFGTFRKALTINNGYDSTQNDLKEMGFSQLKYMLGEQSYFDEMIDLAENLEKGKVELAAKITLTQVIAMKNYNSIYLLTLATRWWNKDQTLLLTIIDDQTDKAK